MNKNELKRNFILLNVGHAYHNADWNWKNICSPFIRIHFIVNGTARIIHHNEVIELKENHLYLTPSYLTHSYECSGTLELYYIHIYEEIDKNLSLFDLMNFPVELAAHPLDLPLIHRLAKINPGRELQYYDPDAYDNPMSLSKHLAEQHRTPIAYEFETEGILWQLFSHFLARATYKREHIEERVSASLQYIHSHIEEQIDVDCLAEICCLTKDHFIRLFKKEMNCTPGKYIVQKKIEKAQLMMLIKDMPIKDIAYSLEMDPAYFNRVFKKVTGETPMGYRRKVR